MRITKRIILINLGIILTAVSFVGCGIYRCGAPGTVNAEMIADIDAQWAQEQVK